MRAMQRTLSVRTSARVEVVDLTPRVAEVVAGAGLAEGVCTVFARHTTTAIVVNEVADRALRADIPAALDRLVPEGIWEHDRIDDNAAAHLKATILGTAKSIPVRDGRLLLGTWQGIALVEFDGPRSREVVVDVRG
jgi:secondary thiamine-phosphate synthase enzyme